MPKPSVFKLVLLVCGIVCLILFFTKILSADVFTRAEALHALNGLELRNDLIRLDFGSFWYNTNRQIVYPFLHSWLQALFFLTFGANYVAARLLSLVLFFAILVLVYLIPSHLNDEHGPKIGILACIMLLSSPAAINFATLNTLETLGTALFLAAAYIYLISEESKLFVHYLLTGLLLGLSIWTHYIYAYLILATFVVVAISKLGFAVYETIHLYRKGEKNALPFYWWMYKKLTIFAIILIVGLVWFIAAFFTRKIQMVTLTVFSDRLAETPLLSFWQNIFYYPKVIIQNFYFSPWIGFLLLFSLLLPLAFIKFKNLRTHYAFCYVALLLLTFSVGAKDPSLIFIIAPSLFLIFAANLILLLENRKNIFVLATISVVLFPTLLNLPSFIQSYLPSPRPIYFRSALDFFRRHLTLNDSFAMTVNIDNLSPDVVKFHFHDWEAPILTDAPVDNPEDLRADYYLTIELDEGVAARGQTQSLEQWNSILQAKMGAGMLEVTAHKNFNNMTAVIYKNVSP